MTGLALFFGILIAVAYRFLRVWEDPRIKEAEEMLPATNCGACGEPGCHGFAEKLVSGACQPSQCTVSADETIAAIAEFLGVDPGKQVKQVARLHCAGGRAEAYQIAQYHGFSSCHAAAIVSGGGKACNFGCLGLGDCGAACTFFAIAMNSNNLPVVDTEKCTACGDCVDACPKRLFEIIPMNRPLLVQCRTTLAGDAAALLCRVACDGCGRCAADAGSDTIKMVNDLPVINYASAKAADQHPIRRCPTKAIAWVEGEQFKQKPLNQIENEKRYRQL